MNFYETMKKEVIRLSAKITVIEKELSKLPEGSLRYRKNKNRYKHYCEKNGKRQYIPLSNMDLIVQLAKKKILKMMLADTQREKNAMEGYLRKHRENDSVMDCLSKEPHMEELVRPLFQIRDERLQKWAEEDYPSTAGFPEELIHEGPGGKMYRSKSEAQIAKGLYKYRLPTRYEWDKKIGEIVYHIDFTIRHPKTGEFFYWEHFGMIDSERYNHRNARKIADYASVDIFPGINLIVTVESRKHPLKDSKIEEVIQKWFL